MLITRDLLSKCMKSPDPYKEFASIIYGTTTDNITPDKRLFAKRIFYLAQYTREERSLEYYQGLLK